MNRLYPHPIIAREGWPFIGGGLILSVLFSMCCGWWSLPFWIFTAFALQFFRDPARNIPQDAEAVLSPVGGRMVAGESKKGQGRSACIFVQYRVNRKSWGDSHCSRQKKLHSHIVALQLRMRALSVSYTRCIPP